uniref:Rho-GAP domain-containing protein n=1 Tax=Rhabditophanes sp. KR3021 TaxID=114890 RepID=A0AC35UA86_9BILA
MAYFRILLLVISWSLVVYSDDDTGYQNGGRKQMMNDEGRLLKYIMHNYDKSVRPVINARKVVEISMGLTLTHIFNINEKLQTMSANVWVEQFWKEERFSWNVSEFGGISKLSLNSQTLWFPDILLLNAQDFSNGFVDTNIHVSSDGSMQWAPPAKIHALFKIDVTYFPFDEQFIQLDFGSWIYDESQLVITTVDRGNGKAAFVQDSFSENGEWEIVNNRTLLITRNRNMQFRTIRFELHLRRRVMYFLYNILLPCVLLSILTLLQFLLPCQSGEKITLGLTVLLSYSIFSFNIAESMPETSEVVPLMSLYLNGIMGISGISVGFSVCVLNLQHKSEGTTQVPRWLKTVAYNMLGSLMGIEPPTKKFDLNGNFLDVNYVMNRKSGNELDIIQSKLNEESCKELLREDWLCVSLIFDRLFLFLVTLITVTTSLVLLIVCPRFSNRSFDPLHTFHKPFLPFSIHLFDNSFVIDMAPKNKKGKKKVKQDNNNNVVVEGDKVSQSLEEIENAEVVDTIGRSEGVSETIENVTVTEDVLQSISATEDFVESISAPEDFVESISAPENIVPTAIGAENIVDTSIAIENVVVDIIGNEAKTADDMCVNSADIQKVMEEIVQEMESSQNALTDTYIEDTTDSAIEEDEQPTTHRSKHNEETRSNRFKQKRFISHNLTNIKKMSPTIYSELIIQPAIQYFLAVLCDLKITDANRQRLGLRYSKTPEVQKLVEKLTTKGKMSNKKELDSADPNVIVSVLKEILTQFPGGIFPDHDEEFISVTLRSSLDFAYLYVTGLIESLPVFLRQFTYLICKALNNLARQSSGSLTDSYTDILLLFTPVLFPNSIKDMSRFLRATRISLILIDLCDKVFKPLLDLSSIQENDNVFFKEVVMNLSKLIENLDDTQHSDYQHIILSYKESLEAMDSLSIQEASADYYHITYVE